MAGQRNTEQNLWSATEACGSAALFQKHPLERFYRDTHLHMMHDRHDIAAQIVGAAELASLRRQPDPLKTAER